MSDSVRPHRRQPTRPHRPWDSLGKNTGVGCHFLLQCMKVKVKSLSHVRLSDPMDCSLPASSVHGIFQARVLEWGAIHFIKSTTALTLRCVIVLHTKKKKKPVGEKKTTTKQNCDNTLYVRDMGYFQVRKAWCRIVYIAYHLSGGKKRRRKGL